MSLRGAFKTDPKVEKDGVDIDYGSAVIRVTRAGSSNRKYMAAFTKAMRPFQSAIKHGSVPDAQLLPVMIKPFAEHVILSWKTRVGDELKPGIENKDPEGELIPATVEAICAFLKEVPDLYYDLHQQAGDRSLFLVDLEEAAGN